MKTLMVKKLEIYSLLLWGAVPSTGGDYLFVDIP
jgi:hypothetical protein